MSKKVKLFNTAVKKPDGTWLGGASLSIPSGVHSVNGMTGDVVLDGQQSLSKDIRYFNGFFDNWYLVRYYDKYFRAEQALGTTPVWRSTTITGLSISDPINLVAEFPIGQITNFEATVPYEPIIGVSPARLTAYNGTVLSYKLLAFATPSDGVKYPYIGYSATRAVPPEKVDWHNDAINESTGNKYGEDAALIAKSYYDADLLWFNEHGKPRFAYEDNWSYNDSTALNYVDGRGLMQCDTLVLMTMLGIPYEKSPYYELKDGTSTVDVPNATFDQYDIKYYYVDDYWHTNWFDITKNGSTRTYNNYLAALRSSGGSAIADCSEEVWDFWRRGWVFKPKSIDKVESGDIICFRTAPGNSDDNGCNFDAVSHVGVCSVEDDGLVIYHFTNSIKIHDPETGYKSLKLRAHRTPWSDYMQYYPEYLTDDRDYYFVRPDYKALQGGDPTP